MSTLVPGGTEHGPVGPGSGVRDWSGALVPDSQQYYQAVRGMGPNGPFGDWLPNPNYNPTTTAASAPSPAPAPPNMQITFDTIGQIIPRTIGHCRLPLKLIWVLGITFSGEDLDGRATTAETLSGSNILEFGSVPSWLAVGDAVIGPPAAIPGNAVISSISGGSVFMSVAATDNIPSETNITFTGGPSTITAAYALCAPIDPAEEGNLAFVFDGVDLIFTGAGGGITPPPGMSPQDQAALALALAGAVIFPGDESQLPAPLIVGDRGSFTPAFRGLRYIIIPGFPISGGTPQLSVVFQRSNPIPTPTTFTAVEFAAGSG